jgi:hypothetical protein
MHTDSVKPAVFLSHAGAQKRIFVDYIYSSFTGSGTSVFLDQQSLEYGRTQADMRSAVDGSCVGEFACDMSVAWHTASIKGVRHTSLDAFYVLMQLCTPNRATQTVAVDFPSC